MLKKEIIEQIIKDRKVRIKITRENHWWFFLVYLGHYITHPPAIFHNELFRITEDTSIKNAVIVSFRNSAKSTIITLSYAIWSILGKQQKKYVLILGHTMYQAQTYMKNIKEEFETNETLRNDLGPFKEEDEWQAYSLVIPKYNARITCASYEKGIRGLRYRQYRPDLIICDDVEDLESVRTLEAREKTYNWLTGDVIPSGDQNTRLIVIGNLLHEDSLIMRLRKNIKDKKLDGIFRSYSLIDNKENITWPGKFPTNVEIDNLRKSVGDEIAYQREYMLIIVPDANRVVHSNWIHYYDKIPKETDLSFMYTATGIDLAISEKETASYTAMVSAKVYGQGEDMRIYILPYPINERMGAPKTLKTAKELSERLGHGRRTKLFIEDVSYQRSLVQNLQKENYPAIGVPTLGQDKRARLATVAPAIENGTVLFPKQGAEILISQLIGFGAEKHNDLADAFAILTGKIIGENTGRPDPFPDQGNHHNDGGITLDPDDHITLDKEF